MNQTRKGLTEEDLARGNDTVEGEQFAIVNNVRRIAMQPFQQKPKNSPAFAQIESYS